MTAAPRRYRRRRGRALAVVGLLLVAGAYLLFAGAADRSPRRTGADATATPAVAAVRIDDVLDDAVTNPDGSVTVTLDRAETSGLVAAALERAPSQPLHDVSVELVDPEGDAAGRMIVDGRLQDPSLPVEAVVDLRVVDDAVRPTVRDLRVGPVPVPAGVAADINRQVQQLALVADERIAVEDLSTIDGALVLTGRRR